MVSCELSITEMTLAASTLMMDKIGLFLLVGDLFFIPVFGELWKEWWTYEGISGPTYWGSHNPDWILCRKGRLQSPIDINPTDLIYDPNLGHLHVNSEKINGILINTGHDLMVMFNESARTNFNFTGGPLSYSYRVFQIKIHFGSMNSVGSEHSVAKKSFPGEIQIIGFNIDLYKNSSQAKISPHGLAAITIFTTIGESLSDQFDILVQKTVRTRTKGQYHKLLDFSIPEIIPSTENYITYEGSITQPGCYETVTWIILNKPLHITEDQLRVLRSLNSAEGNVDPLMENNFRPLMPINGRLVRTNIKTKRQDKECKNKRLTFYAVNDRFT